MNIRDLAQRALPVGSRRRMAVNKFRALINGLASNNNETAHLSYEDWIKYVEPSLFQDEAVESKLLISIVVPAFNTPDKYLVPLLDSIIAQRYPNWQLCLVDASTEDERSHAIKKAASSDKRIDYIRLEENKGISGNTNEGISRAKGEFIGFVDHDDTLSPYALQEIVAAIETDPSLDLVYSDEDKLSDNGRERLLPFFKPDWSPELLMGVNYITHFVVARKATIEKISGLRVGFDGAQDFDFLLRLTELSQKIHHIPKILYHWRLADGSTSKEVGEKSYADDAGQRALKDAIKRRKIKAEVVEIPERPTNYRLRYEVSKELPTVSIIIPFKDKVEYLEKLIPSILDKTTYKNYEVLLISNNSTEQSTHDYLAKLTNEPKCKIIEWNNTFNYSAINNFGRKQATGEYLVFLNNDTEIVTPEWLEELVGTASQSTAGAVGPLLRYPDTRIQHAGVILGMGGMAGHVFRFLQPEQWTHFGLPHWPRNYLAVTGACLVVSAQKFDEVGGFDEKLTIGGNDVALGLMLYEAGYRNIYWPFAEVIHYENVSVGPYASNVPVGDYNRSLEYYDKYLKSGDPYFNSNLDLMNEQIALKDKAL